MEVSGFAEAETVQGPTGPRKEESQDSSSTDDGFSWESTVALLRNWGLTGVVVHHITAVMVVMGVVGALFAPAIYSTALGLDDSEYVWENPLVLSPSPFSASVFFSEVRAPSTVHGYYQPLTMTSLLIDSARRSRPDDAMPFHTTNWLLHTVNAGLVYGLLFLLFRSVPAAMMGALCFALHPFTVGCVPWISERKTLLATFFATLSMSAYVGWTSKRQWRLFGASIAFFVLGLLSKPTIVPLPFLLLLIDMWPLRRLSASNAGDWINRVREKVPLFVLAVVFAGITIVSQKAAVPIVQTQLGPWGVVLQVTNAVVYYLVKTVIPISLSPHVPLIAYPSIADFRFIFGLVGSGALAGFLYLRGRRYPHYTIPLLFFIVAVLPTTGIIGFTNVLVADKYMYLPLIGLAMIPAWWFARRGYQDLREMLRGGVPSACALCGIVYLGVCQQYYLSQWATTEKLFRYSPCE